MQKIISGLTFGGALAEYVQSHTIGVAVPTGLIASGSASGGSLAAGTYYYVVTGLNGTGETTGSNEVSVTTTGSTSSVALSWSAMPGATGYRVYRGTSAGSESVYFAAATISFLDTGGSGTSGTVPVSNTTGTSWTPTLPDTPIQAFYLRNVSSTGNVTATITPSGGSGAAHPALPPNGAQIYLAPVAVSGGGITAVSLVASVPGVTVEGIWGA